MNNRMNKASYSERTDANFAPEFNYAFTISHTVDTVIIAVSIFLCNLKALINQVIINNILCIKMNKKAKSINLTHII